MEVDLAVHANDANELMQASLPTPPMLSSSPPTPAPSPSPLQQPLPSWQNTPDHEEANLRSVRAQFASLSVCERERFLAEVLNLCDTELLSFVHGYVSPRLKKDFLRFLPTELGLRILSFIDDPQTLARSSQVSKHWYNLLNDDLTWKLLCRKHKYRRLSNIVSDNQQSLSMEKSESPYFSGPADTAKRRDLCESPSRRPRPTSYKSHFKHTYMVDAAWRTGGRTLARHITADYGVVTALHLTQRYIIVALDNTKIHVFADDGRFLRTLNGHTLGVWAIEPWEDRLVSGGCDKDVRVWQISTGTTLQILRGHTSTVRCIKMCDRKTAISGSRDTTLRIWDLESGHCRHVLVGHQASVRCLEVHGNICVSGSYDTTARIWDIENGVCLGVLRGHFSQIYALAFDGVRIATGSLDTTVRVWDPKTAQCTDVLNGHTSLVGQLQIRGNILVSGGSDGGVRVWDLGQMKCMHRIMAHDNSVTSLQFDEKRILSGGSDGRVKVWDVNTGQQIRDLCGQSTAVWRVGLDEDKAVILASRANRMAMEVISFSPMVQTSTSDPNFRLIAGALSAEGSVGCPQGSPSRETPTEQLVMFEMTD